MRERALLRAQRVVRLALAELLFRGGHLRQRLGQLLLDDDERRVHPRRVALGHLLDQLVHPLAEPALGEREDGEILPHLRLARLHAVALHLVGARDDLALPRRESLGRVATLLARLPALLSAAR